jgi:hypothetical protein
MLSLHPLLNCSSHVQDLRQYVLRAFYHYIKYIVKVEPVAAAMKVQQESARIEKLLVQNGAMQRAQSSLDATLNSGTDTYQTLWHLYDDNHYVAVDA